RGEPLGIVHRDVSPQNIIVGVDGVARVVDFGVAKAAGRLQTTRDGQLKGKLSYMAPEQLSGGIADRRTDVYAASVVLWEALAGPRQVGQRVQLMASGALQRRAEKFVEIESVTSVNTSAEQAGGPVPAPTGSSPRLSNPSGVSAELAAQGIDPRSASQLTNL